MAEAWNIKWVVDITHNNDHLNVKTPEPVRSPKLSAFEWRQYLRG